MLCTRSSILAIVLSYMSVFTHQKPSYLLPSVNIPVKAVIIIRLFKIHLFFWLNLRKILAEFLIVESNTWPEPAD